ncbi:ligand-binding sensor domain-containing protein/signal transduction histidine kinase [Silvibacterium bohemicum]|uniref:Ligand-binding sensor domain-containing protein/signal transduction histidine kinase n=1 Tax=Silvibacterium bohemicum TaxID=1577686 RepID=A0A841JPE5_9BACT|nr:sensor histidine kinase [Silvibacterium bohemicum]MBB6143173.1 ligand-binding sensor domain-containing protein/signal transduction histidine kinase [Silvibacterium bohemicum]
MRRSLKYPAGTILLSLLLCCAASAAFTDDPTRLQYTQHVWHVQDGLPEEPVQAIEQTPDGYLWIGTTGGLVRFDGSLFLTYSRSNTPSMTENSIFCLHTGRDGSLWLGTEGGGLLRYKNGVFRAYRAAQGLSESFVRSVAEDEQGQLWVGTDSGLFRIIHDRAERVDTSQVAPSLAIHSVYEDREHRIWAGGSRLLMFEGGRIHEFKLSGDYSQNRVKTILQTSDGTVWVGTVSGLQRLNGGSFEPVQGITGTVRSLRQTGDGTLWIGTIGHGLFTYRDGRLQQVSGNGLLPSKTVLSIDEDNTHQLWVGTQDGLVRLSRTPVSVVPLPGGSDSDFETISYDNEGTVWAVSSRVYAIRQEHAVPYTFAAIAGIPVRNVFRDRQGTLWIGTDGSGAYHLTPQGPMHYSSPATLANNFVRGFMESRDGAIWIATDEGVTRVAGGRVNNFRVGDGLVYFSTRALLEDQSGNIWIGTDQGLSCWNNGRFLHNEVTQALAQEKIWSMLQDKEGVIWFGTRDHGLFRYRSGRLTQFTTLDGLASNSIYQILEDRFRQLWISSPNSISSIPLASFDADSQGTAAQLAVTTYDMPYDAGGVQMYGGRQPSGCIGKDGSLWFPSNKGALHIYPEPAARFTPPQLLLSGIAVDGRQITAADFHSLSADAARLEIAFAPLSLRSQEDTRFRYRLEPFDRTWTYAGVNQVAAYTNLPPGNYRFRVVAFPLNNPTAISEVDLNFRKPPHFYASWWFLTLCVMLAGLIGFAGYHWRMRSLRLRFRAVLEERSRLAREMHDTVIQGCTSVSALLEAISSLERENSELNSELLQYARTQVRTTIDEARQAVWNLRGRDEPQQDISQALAIIVEQTSKEFAVPIHCSHDGVSFPVPHSVAHEILMVIREALYNAVLHGKPSEVWVDLVYGREDFRAMIRDNGEGFVLNGAPADGKPHYGMAGMRERIEQLNGKIEWTSIRGEGTTVRFRIRRSALFPHNESIEI